VRAAAEPFIPWRPTAGDRSVADVVGERFGPDVVDRLVEPLLGGVYAGRADELSVQSTAPMIAEAIRTKRSLTAALREHRHRTIGSNQGPVFQTLAGGLQRLTDELAGRLGDRVRLETPVVAVEPTAVEATADAGWRVTTTAGIVEADAVVLCVPAHHAADLLLPTSRSVAAELAGITYASVAVVTLAYGPHARDELPPGSGMLVPRSEGRLVKASTWVSRKWPHQAGGDHVLLRASVGRVDDARWMDLDEDDLVTRVDAEIRRATGISRPAQDAMVTRWERSLPQYVVGHAARVDRIRAELPDGIFVAGAAYDGVGISPCVASARAAARGAEIHARRPATT
jgi:oxygen-dependent protoporphyrinogen oxidase